MFTTLSITSLNQGKLYPQQKAGRSSYQSDIDAAIARHEAAQVPADHPQVVGAWIATQAGKLRVALLRSARKQPSLRPAS